MALKMPSRKKKQKKSTQRDLCGGEREGGSRRRWRNGTWPIKREELARYFHSAGVGRFPRQVGMPNEGKTPCRGVLIEGRSGGNETTDAKKGRTMRSIRSYIAE